MISLLSTLYSLVPFLFIGYYFYQMRKRENIQSDINMGLKCYSCKEDIISYEDFILEKISGLSNPNLNDIKGEPRICQSCERDNRINLLFGKKINKLDRFLISDKYLLYQKYLLGAIIGFVVIDLVFNFILDIKYLSFLSPTVNCIFWYFMIKRMKITTIKKPAKN